MPVVVKGVVSGIGAIAAGKQIDIFRLGMFFAVLLVDIKTDEDCIANLTGVHSEGCEGDNISS